MSAFGLAEKAPRWSAFLDHRPHHDVELLLPPDVQTSGEDLPLTGLDPVPVGEELAGLRV